MDTFAAHIEANRQRYFDELCALLRQPSIAAQGVGIEETAALVAARLERLGAEVRLLRVEPHGAPVVFGSIGSGPRTLLIYDHYDVQPPEPLELWHSPPFEPTLRDGGAHGPTLHARGAADNKGNTMLRIQAVETWLATQGALPIRINFMVEGEEEIGSAHLEAWCRQHADLLRADGCLWETGGKNALEQPTIMCGAKGICYVELVARGAAYDLHSANATVVPNPAWRLTWALATLKGPDERIRIPGFYDRVRPPSAADLQALERIPDDDEALLADYKIPQFLGGVRGVERQKVHMFSPTCTICGLVSGYTGQGSKTVLPSEARAKVDFRLVPDQDPHEIARLLRAHLDAQGFGDIEIVPFSQEHPARSDVDSPVVRAMARAIRETYGQEAVVYPTMAGTGPMYPVCTQFGTPVASGAGTGYQGTQVHAPNENIRMEDYWAAMRCMGAFIRAFAEG
ncbi:MAG TPA: M20/M25/M40 family metallo-hydrolase [Roseiflexaceae bacterium]|nr:M20/M25/M40 family metallo-hydrolase [Roseiflexaceae bacterium]